MNTNFEFPLSEKGDIVFRIDRYNSSLFEIAKLKDDGESSAYNAVRFGLDKLNELCKLVELGLKTKKSDIAMLTTKINGTQVRILNKFGLFNAEYHDYLFSYTDWGGSDKYDFHPWYNNYTECDKGIRLTEEECSELLAILRLFILTKEKYRKSKRNT